MKPDAEDDYPLTRGLLCYMECGIKNECWDMSGEGDRRRSLIGNSLQKLDKKKKKLIRR